GSTKTFRAERAAAAGSLDAVTEIHAAYRTRLVAVRSRVACPDMERLTWMRREGFPSRRSNVSARRWRKKRHTTASQSARKSNAARARRCLTMYARFYRAL